MNILFVCLGNICRSPMAEGIMRHIYDERSLPGLIDSAGTADWNVGHPASALSIAVAREHGIDITAHRARQICPDDFSRFDRIYCMDRDNELTLKNLAPEASRHKIRLLRSDADVSDPYSGTQSVYRHAFEVIEEACLKIAAQFNDSGASSAAPGNR